jgi:hypothetical protein
MSVSTPVAMNFIFVPLFIILLPELFIPINVKGSWTVVYQPVVPSRSVTVKYPVHCPLSVIIAEDTHVLPMKNPVGAVTVGFAIFTTFVLPVVVLNCEVFNTYHV